MPTRKTLCLRAEDVRAKTSEWPTTRNVARPVNASAFLGTNPSGELITSRLSVIRPESMRSAVMNSHKPTYWGLMLWAFILC